jgi:hypothetical protein
LSLQAVSAEVLTEYSHLARWERAERKPPADAVARLDRLYEAGGFLVALHAAALAKAAPAAGPVVPSQWDGEGMDVLRRRLLGGMAAVGANAAAPPALDGIEQLRGVVDGSVGRAGIGEWEEVAWEYAHAVFSPDISEVIRDLSVDVLAFQQAISAGVPSGEAGLWLRVNTRLTILLAYALGCSGQTRESRHWWSVAGRAAGQTGDQELLALVYAGEAVQALHERRSVQLVMSRTTQALELTGGRACVATSAAYGARAHARALAGDVAGAYADLDEQARLFEALPANVTADRVSVDGWPETRVLYSRSLVYTLTGHPEVDVAQQEAIAAHGSPESRQQAQVELHRATTEVQRGHIESGLGHAGAVLGGMHPDSVNRFVLHNAVTVGAAVPVAQRGRPAVAEYREMLALPIGRSQ